MKKLDIVYILTVVAIVAISLGITHAIYTSDLPEWLKFWLLM